MIASLTIIILAFLWLGCETKWLTTMLLVGVDKPPIIPCTQHEINFLRNRFFRNGFGRSMKVWGSYIRDSMANPLCGWEYIRDYGELQQEYKMEVIAHGVTNRIILKNPGNKLLKDIARSMLYK